MTIIAFIHTLVVGVSVVYLALLTALIGARLVVPSRALRGVLMTLFGVLLVMALPLLILATFFGNMTLVLLLCIPLGIFVFNYVPLLIPRADRTIPPDAITVLSFNVEIEQDADELTKLAAIIRDADADIVGLQELSPAGAEQLGELLSDVYPHQAMYPNEDYIYAGQGVLSRYDIVEDEYWGHPKNSRDALGHIRAEIVWNGHSLTLYNTHPMPPLSFEENLKPQSHEEAVEELLERADADDNPTLLIGDFNITHYFEDYNHITEKYGDALRDASPTIFGFTFPDGDRLPLPRLVQLDYIFYSPHFTAHRANLWERSGNADHRPVRAVLSLSEDTNSQD